MLKNITLSAEEKLIAIARKKAVKNNITLNELFRQWLAGYAREKGLCGQLDDFLKKANYAVPGDKFSREELNER